MSRFEPIPKRLPVRQRIRVTTGVVHMSENPYDQQVALSKVIEKPNYASQRLWIEHQEMQEKFLDSRGFGPSSNVLDVGCGPLRLGVKLIPRLDTGWYFGQDINQGALDLGKRVLADAGVTSSSYRLFSSRNFDLSPVDRKIDLAFSNSLFSHLNLNSILICLLRVRETLKASGVYYSTFFLVDGQEWLKPCARQKWGRDFHTFPDRDPYHYSLESMSAMARRAGFRLRLVDDYGHPTQTMGCFVPE